MKKNILPIFSWICLCLVWGLTSCEMKDELLKKPSGGNGETSSAQLGALTLNMNVQAPTFSGTKADNSSIDLIVPSVDDIEVKIFDQSMELQQYFESYAEFKAAGSHFLKAGTYYIEAYSGTNHDATLMSPYYEKTDTVEIKAKEVTTADVICEMQSAIIYLRATEDFLNDCLDDYVIIVTSGNGIVTVGKNDPNTIYVKPGLKVTITIKATEKKTNTPVIKTFILADSNGNISSKDLFVIEIKDLEEDITPDEPEKPDPTPDPNPDPDPDPKPDPDPEKPSSGNFNIKVDVTLNEKPIDIIVPSTPGNPDKPGEDEDDDNEGGDNEGDSGNEEAITITGDAINSDLKVTAPNGISSFRVTIDSPILPPEELEGIGLKSEFDLANPGTLSSALSGLGFPVNIEGEISVSFNISNFVPMLELLGKGTSKFILNITDSKGNTATKTITVTT